MSNTSHLCPGQYAVVIPADQDQPVRVIDWRESGEFDLLYRELDTQVVEILRANDLGIWIDENACMREGWIANARATFLAMSCGQSLIVPGDAVITLGEPDDEGDTQGLARELADRTAEVANATPDCNVEGLTAIHQEAIDRGPTVMTLDSATGQWVEV